MPLQIIRCLSLWTLHVVYKKKFHLNNLNNNPYSTKQEIVTCNAPWQQIQYIFFYNWTYILGT